LITHCRFLEVSRSAAGLPIRAGTVVGHRDVIGHRPSGVIRRRAADDIGTATRKFAMQRGQESTVISASSTVELTRRGSAARPRTLVGRRRARRLALRAVRRAMLADGPSLLRDS
jgi:hypothetical protein